MGTLPHQPPQAKPRSMIWAWHLPEPVRTPSGKCYVSRAVLYDEIGLGPHQCHWCFAAIDWLPKADPAALQADHLDGDTMNDDPANLVQSCRRCNAARGKGVLTMILALLERSGHATNLDQAELWGPIKVWYDCGHDFVLENTYVLGANAHSRFNCLSCRRTKARDYARSHA